METTTSQVDLRFAVDSKRPTTRAARDLCAHLRGSGFDITEREIERWRHEYGLIEPTRRPADGGPKAYGTHAAQQAKEVKTLLDEGFTLTDIVATQFVRGNYVKTEPLKRALIEQIRQTLGGPGKPLSWVQAKPIARARARSWVNRLARDRGAQALRRRLFKEGRRVGERINQTTQRLIYGILFIYLAGAPHTRKGLKSIFTGLGLGEINLDIQYIVELLPALQHTRLEAAVRVASREDLEQALVDRRVFVALAKEVGAWAARYMTDERVAVQIAGILSVHKEVGPALRSALDDQRERLMTDPRNGP